MFQASLLTRGSSRVVARKQDDYRSSDAIGGITNYWQYTTALAFSVLAITKPGLTGQLLIRIRISFKPPPFRYVSELRLPIHVSIQVGVK